MSLIPQRSFTNLHRGHSFSFSLNLVSHHIYPAAESRVHLPLTGDFFLSSSEKCFGLVGRAHFCDTPSHWIWVRQIHFALLTIVSEQPNPSSCLWKSLTWVHHQNYCSSVFLPLWRCPYPQMRIVALVFFHTRIRLAYRSKRSCTPKQVISTSRSSELWFRYVCEV